MIVIVTFHKYAAIFFMTDCDLFELNYGIPKYEKDACLESEVNFHRLMNNGPKSTFVILKNFQTSSKVRKMLSEQPNLSTSINELSYSISRAQSRLVNNEHGNHSYTEKKNLRKDERRS